MAEIDAEQQRALDQLRQFPVMLRPIIVWADQFVADLKMIGRVIADLPSVTRMLRERWAEDHGLVDGDTEDGRPPL